MKTNKDFSLEQQLVEEEYQVCSEELPQAQKILDEDDTEVNEHLFTAEDLYDEQLEQLKQKLHYKRRHQLPLKLLNVKSNHWFGTHNDGTFLESRELNQVCFFNNDKIEWIIIYEEEAPTTGHVHYHSLLVLKKPCKAHICFSIDPRASWEKVRGQLKTAFNYIRKDDKKYYEWGVMPNQLVFLLEREEMLARKRIAPSKSALQWADLLRRAKRGDESIRDEQVYARNMAYFDQILAQAHQDRIYDEDLETKNLWIYGPPGTGKSRLIWAYAKEHDLTIYVKLQNKWWDGYNGQNIVYIEDAGENMKVLASHVKNWADRYPFTAEIKGTTRRINACDYYLIVTSNYSIEEIFNGTDAEAIRRRFDVHHMK